MTLVALRLAVPLVAALIGAASGWAARGVLADRDTSALQAQHAQQSAAALAAAAAESARITTQYRRIADEHASALSVARRDAAGARAAAVSLRESAARAASAASSASGAGCADASDAAGVLADVLGRADDRAGVLAAHADELAAALAACLSAVRE